MNKDKSKFDFTAFGQAIKAARKAQGYSRNRLADELNIAPRYIASIENSGQHPSLQIFYELVTLLDISVDTFFFPDKETDKSTQRRQLETLLDGVSDKGLRSVVIFLRLQRFFFAKVGKNRFSVVVGIEGESFVASIGSVPNPLKTERSDTMANRTRPLILRVPVNEQERELIEQKMKLIPTKNFAAYARKSRGGRDNH